MRKFATSLNIPGLSCSPIVIYVLISLVVSLIPTTVATPPFSKTQYTYEKNYVC